MVISDPSMTARAKFLAEESLADGTSLEQAQPWPSDLPMETCHLNAQFHTCCDSRGNGSAGLAIFLETSLQPCEICYCRVSLGSQCTTQTSSYQACGFLLHALLFLSSLLSSPLHESHAVPCWVRVTKSSQLHLCTYSCFSLVLCLLHIGNPLHYGAGW